MMRLPDFDYRAPRELGEAVRILAEAGPGARPLGGGTDLLPNMKRRHQLPHTLVALGGIAALRTVEQHAGLDLGTGLTLSEVARQPIVQRDYAALWQAAVQVATPPLRNMATLGGNLFLDTRCTYYDQSYEWRKAIDFCMKKDGETCWVAPSSPRCLAVSSTDTAPALIALGARIALHSVRGEREIPLATLYANDGMRYVTSEPDEIVTRVRLAPAAGWRSTYWKLRRRGAFDFPVLSVAAAARLDPDGTVAEARIVLGAVASWPLVAQDAADGLVGGRLRDDAITAAAALAARRAKPVDNTDFTLHWRKAVATEFVGYALSELRGDDMRETRRRIARHGLDPALG